MFIIANLLLAFARITDILLTLYTFIIIARAIISWVSPDPYNPIVNFLYRATEPILYRVRALLPDLGGIDLSPLVVLLVIQLLQRFAVTSVIGLAWSLKTGTGAFQ
jgi:YggT family protein